MHKTKISTSKKVSMAFFFFSQAPLAVIDKTEKKKKIGLNFRFHATAATIRYILILIILKGKPGIRASAVFNEKSDLAYHAIFFHVHPIG